jgi:hypothetical protein
LLGFFQLFRGLFFFLQKYCYLFFRICNMNNHIYLSFTMSFNTQICSCHVCGKYWISKGCNHTVSCLRWPVWKRLLKCTGQRPTKTNERWAIQNLRNESINQSLSKKHFIFYPPYKWIMSSKT